MVVVLLVAYAAFTAWAVLSQPDHRQWDLRVYYAAAKVHSAGGDPYDPDALAAVLPDTKVFPWVYPPYALWLFRPLAWFSYPTVFHAWLLLKFVALGFLFASWRRYFAPPSGNFVLLLALCALAFRETTIRNLYQGNVTEFEQLLLWTGFLFLVRGRPGLFALFVTAASLWKPPSVLLLGFGFLDLRHKGHIAMAGGAVALIAVNAVSYGLDPAAYTSFIDGVGAMNEPGRVNPTFFNLLRELREAAGGGPVLEAMSLAVFAAYFVGLSIVAARALRGLDLRRDRVPALMLGLLFYAAVMPRFKDYQYMLLLVPAWHVLHSGVWRGWRRAGLVAGLCVSFFTYQQLVLTLLLFGSYVIHLRASAASASKNPG